MNYPLDVLYQLVKGKSIALVGGFAAAIDHHVIPQCDLICGAHNHAKRAGYEPHIVVSGWDAPMLSPRTEVCVVNIANPQAHETLKACAIGGQSVIPYDSHIYEGLNPHGTEFEWSNVFGKELKTTPFTGIIALRLLLSLPIKSVFITGFTFYAKGPNQFPFLVPPHHVEPQVEWLKDVLESDARVSIDSTLKHLLPPRLKVIKHTKTKIIDGIHWRE